MWQCVRVCVCVCVCAHNKSNYFSHWLWVYTLRSQCHTCLCVSGALHNYLPNKDMGYTLLRRCDGWIWHSVSSHPKPQATLPSHKLPLSNTRLATSDSSSGCQVSRVTHPPALTCGFNGSIVCQCCFCCSRVAFLSKWMLFYSHVIESYPCVWRTVFNPKACNSPYTVFTLSASLLFQPERPRILHCSDNTHNTL